MISTLAIVVLGTRQVNLVNVRCIVVLGTRQSCECAMAIVVLGTRQSCECAMHCGAWHTSIL
jgi:hypothetical protein